MDPNCFNKRFTTSDGDIYAYDYIPASRPSASTFLLIHGYPSSRHDWRHQIPALTAAGHGFLAPDCLGYGDSSKPTNIEAYRLKRLSGHFAELLSHVGVSQVIGVSHDWGSMLMSRIYVWHPLLFSHLIFISAGYCPPGVFFDVDGLNVASQATLGYMQLGYWYFLNTYDAADVMLDHLESFFHLAYPDSNTVWLSSLAAINGMRTWLVNDRVCALPGWLEEGDKERWMEITRGEDGLSLKASVNYYRSMMRGIQVEDEKGVADEMRMLRVPVLGVCGSEDMVTRADQIGPGTRPWARMGYEEKLIKGAGHWVMLERREEVSKILLGFAGGSEDEKAKL